MKPEFNRLSLQLNQALKDADFPPIIFEGQKAYCNNGEPFMNTYQLEEGQSITLAIDTSTDTNEEMITEVRKTGGIALFQDKRVFSEPGGRKEQTIVFSEIGFDLNFKIDKESLSQWGEKGVGMLLLGVTGGLLLFLALWNLALWGTLSIIFSGKARECGGGNSSLALWILAPPTLFLTLLLPAGAGGCMACMGYFIALILSAVFMQRVLVPVPVEDDEL